MIVWLEQAGMRVVRTISQMLPYMLLGALAGCAGSTVSSGGPRSFAMHHHSPPPGPPGDPWGPYIREAATRFGLPQRWIRAVMRQESGGQEEITSSAGAMGLMQVMPATYAQLAARYGLGDDPYDPHDNMLAGVAYLREMYDRYGSPNFLAAYNAGPGRLDAYLAGANTLPDETVSYMAAIAPRLGPAPAPAAPPVAYAAASPSASFLVARAPAPVLINAPPCDPDLAYDPRRACQDVPGAPVSASALVAAPPCDPDAAYDPRRRCTPVPQSAEPAPVVQLAAATTMSPAPPLGPRMPVAAAPLPPPATVAGAWAIQVGAFPLPSLARDVLAQARSSAPEFLATARVALPATTPFGGQVLYRARLTALSPVAARQACAKLLERGLDCVVVPPDLPG